VNVVSKIGDVPVPVYQTLWTNTFSALKSKYQTLVQQYPEADAQLKQLLKVLGNIEDVARHIPDSVGESAE
jgi:chaperonin cofactor prefoldin